MLLAAAVAAVAAALEKHPVSTEEQAAVVAAVALVYPVVLLVKVEVEIEEVTLTVKMDLLELKTMVEMAERVPTMMRKQLAAVAAAEVPSMEM